MKKKLGPSWSQAQQEEGERMKKAWEEFFSKTKPAKELPFSHHFENAKIAEIRARHETKLMGYPNVVGVSEGFRSKQGKATSEACIVVYVEKKIPRDKLTKSDILPSQIEGVAVDVVQVGKVEALSL